MKENVFICGTPRSGTSALTALLNHHPDLCIGFERFAMAFKLGTVRPEMFAPDRFARIEPGDAGYQSFGDPQAAARWQARAVAARYVGDKVPTLFRHFALVEERFPAAKIIFIVRDPLAVASSYKARQQREPDAWRWGPRDALAAWNEGLAKVIEYRDRLAIHVVTYAILTGGEGIEGLAAFLGVDPAPLVQASPSFQQREVAIAKVRQHPLSHDEIAMIRDGVDMAYYTRATGLAALPT